VAPRALLTLIASVRADAQQASTGELARFARSVEPATAPASAPLDEVRRTSHARVASGPYSLCAVARLCSSEIRLRSVVDCGSDPQKTANR
jgi:hypothetical protein